MNVFPSIRFEAPSFATASGVAALGRRARLFRAGAIAVGAPLAASVLGAGHAFAQAASTAGSIGAQLNNISSEGIDSGGTMIGMTCYLLALVVFVGAAWALWQSRQDQNRGNGYVARGVAGLVLSGLFVMAPQWVNKASHTVAGADSTINNTPAQVKFAP